MPLRSVLHAIVVLWDTFRSRRNLTLAWSASRMW